MIIEFSELKKAFSGAVDFIEKNGCLCPRRFTKKQFDHFVDTENYIHKLWKGKSCSGMDIDFYTDSEYLKLDTFCYTASSQSYCYFDVYVDGKHHYSCGYDAAENTDFEVFTKLPSGYKRVTVYLPCLFGVDIKSFELSENSGFEPYKKTRKLLFLGDSITQGYTAEHPSLTYTSIVSRGLNAEGVNHGIGANVFNDKDLDPDLPYSPDIIFVAFGTNDWTHNRDIKTESQKYLSELIKIYPHSKIYVILPIWRGRLSEHEAKTTVTFSEMHDILKCACEDFAKVRIIDGRDLVPNDPKLFRPDTTHPNENGFNYYGNELLKAIE